MLVVKEGDRWYRRAYDGTADHAYPVRVSRVWEGIHESSGRIDWQIEIDFERSMLAGSFLALHTQLERS